MSRGEQGVRTVLVERARDGSAVLRAVRGIRSALVFSALALLAVGCASKVDEDYQVGSGNVHPFAGTEEHGDWLAANGYAFSACTDCHGADWRGQPVGKGGEYLRSCSATGCHDAEHGGPFACNVCHGDFAGDGGAALAWAPPEDLEGASDTSLPSIGAHQTHLGSPSGISAPVPCLTCHLVPSAWDDPGHLDEGAARAEIHFGGIADEDASYDFTTNTCAVTYCHGNEEPLWTQVDGTWNECGTCHGLPPQRQGHPQGPGAQYCYLCHITVVDEDRVIIAPELHVNGEVDED
jgi:predicted CxxxxCH...CXXCH cytochrome family protein